MAGKSAMASFAYNFENLKSEGKSMKNKLLTLCVLLALSLSMACGDGGPSSPGGAGPNGSVSSAVKKIWESGGGRVPMAQDVKQTSSKGITVYSRAGLSQAHLDQADEALTELFADVAAAYPDQTDPVSVNFAAYDIFEPDHDCMPSPEQRVPSFYVKDGSLSYDESPFDQYPGAGKSVVMAPERVFSMTTTGSSIWVNGSKQPARARMLVCPDLGHWKSAVRYGGEHNVAESGCNLTRVADDGSWIQNALCHLAGANRVHSQGSGHPFIPSRAAGLVGKPKANWSEFAPLWGE